jgi:hypothetical protein
MNTQLNQSRLNKTAKTLPRLLKARGPKSSLFDPVAYAAALEVLG